MYLQLDLGSAQLYWWLSLGSGEVAVCLILYLALQFVATDPVLIKELDHFGTWLAKQ